MGKYLMGIDNGSTAIKVGIYDLDGNEISVGSRQCEVIMPKPGYYERSVEKVWQANAEAIREAIEKAGIDSAEIKGISLTGHGNGIIVLDENGNPLHNSIESMDTRAAGIVKKWMSDGTYDRIHPKNLQILWAAMSLCLMGYMKENHPEIYNNTKYMFACKDFVRYCLTGVANQEVSDACGGGCINTKELRVDRDMLADAGIPEVADMIPPLIGSTDIAGYVTAEAAKETGLTEGTPVIGGLYDVNSAAVATGTLDDTFLNVIVGTWCNNQYVSQTPIEAKDFFSTIAYGKKGYYLMVEGSPTSASNLEWFVQEFMDLEKKQAKAEGTSVYDVCNKAVEAVPADASEIVFLPYLYGSNALPSTRSVFLGLQGWHKRGDILRAIYEGICFSHRRHIEKIGRYTDLSGIKVVRMAGGAARSQVWMQMFADVLKLPVETTAATELGNLGAAICAGVGVGIYKDLDEGINRTVKVAKRVEPNAEAAKIYDAKYEKFNKAIEKLADFWE